MTTRLVGFPSGSASDDELATATTDDRTLISTDGWNAYPGAVDLAFANTVDYGIIIKDFTESEQPGRYGPPELAGTQRRPVTKGLDPFDICTSHVERHNLSIRTFLRRYRVLLITVLTFALVRLAPGGPSILMNPDLSAAQREQFRRNLGLD